MIGPKQLTIALLLGSQILNAQNHQPVINKFVVSHDSTKKKVTIEFDVYNYENNKVQIDLLISKDNGTFIQDSNLRGKISQPVKCGHQKIIWKYKKQSDVSGKTIHVIAYDSKKINTAEIIDRIDTSNIKAIMRRIFGIRHFLKGKNHLDSVRKYITSLMSKDNLHFENQGFTSDGFTGQNLITNLSGNYHQKKIFALGAHYDTVDDSPGADDNSSGVAGMLEILRIINEFNTKSTVRFIAFDLEEIGKGSRNYIRELDSSDTIAVYYNLDMIGYYSSKANSQIFPEDLRKPFESQYDKISAEGFRGDFILLFANENSQKYMDHLDMISKKYVPNLKMQKLVVKDDGKFAENAFRASDHVSFWDAGIKAVSIGDTGPARNPFYHAPEDRLESIDYKTMLKVLKVILASIIELSEISSSTSVYYKIEVIKGSN